MAFAIDPTPGGGTDQTIRQGGTAASLDPETVETLTSATRDSAAVASDVLPGGRLGDTDVDVAEIEAALVGDENVGTITDETSTTNGGSQSGGSNGESQVGGGGPQILALGGSGSDGMSTGMIVLILAVLGGAAFFLSEGG